MEQKQVEGIKIVEERFGKDNVIALGTVDGEYPAIRNVNAYYEDGAFYVITYALSNKMQQIGKNLLTDSGNMNLTTALTE